MEHFILKVPTGEKTNYFTREIISFLLIWVILVTGLLICIWGYKYFQTLTVLILGCISGYVGIQLTDYLTDWPVMKMVFFVMFTFLGTCFFYGVSIVIDSLLKFFKIKKGICNKMYVLTSILGAVIASLIIYTQIYDSWQVNVTVFLMLSVFGSIYQKKKQKLRPQFHSYEDIFKMEILNNEGSK